VCDGDPQWAHTQELLPTASGRASGAAAAIAGSAFRVALRMKAPIAATPAVATKVRLVVHDG